MWYYVVVKSSLKHAREECESKRTCVLGASCLVCLDLVSCSFTLFYCLLVLSYDECTVISLYFLCCSDNGSVVIC